MAVKEEVSLPSQRICVRCKFVSSQEVCKACVLLEGLNKGLPRLGIGKSSKAKRMLEEYNANQPPGNTLEVAIKDLNDDSGNNSTDKPARHSRSKLNSKNNKENCSNNCSGKCSKETIEPSNSKINNLLEEYGLDETSNVKVSGNETDNSDDELISNEQEDETCSGTCGKMGSVQIGF